MHRALFMYPNGVSVTSTLSLIILIWLTRVCVNHLAMEKSRSKGVPRQRASLLWRDALCLHRSRYWRCLLRWRYRGNSKGSLFSLVRHVLYRMVKERI